jgi:hypothetical protein
MIESHNNSLKMNLIKDTDLRKILNIKEEEGEWLLTSFKFFFRIEKLNQLYNENSTLSGLEFIDSVIKKLNIKYTVSEEFEKRPSPWGIGGIIIIKTSGQNQT